MATLNRNLGSWDEYPGRRSCARNHVTWYNLEQSDWFGINYHIGILVYSDSTDSPLDAGSPTPVQKLQISLGKTNAVLP